MIMRSFSPGEEKLIWALCQRAFAGYPWFEAMSDEAIENRWKRHVGRSGFCCLVAEVDTVLAAVSWFHEITNQEILEEKGPALNNFVLANFPDIPKIWVDATITDPVFQKKGFAVALKERALRNIRSAYNEALVLTRMRDDNIGIIRINEKFGFHRTGARSPSVGQNAQNEFWYMYLGKA